MKTVWALALSMALVGCGEQRGCTTRFVEDIPNAAMAFYEPTGEVVRVVGRTFYIGGCYSGQIGDYKVRFADGAVIWVGASEISSRE